MPGFKLNIGKAINKAVGNISKGFAQENNPFKKLHENLQSIKKPNLQNIGEQLNVNKPNIKEGMDMKYGTGDFATGGSKAAQRMKPGESQHQYNVRMQRAKSKSISSDTGIDIEEKDDPMFNEPGYDPTIHGNIEERAAGDKREQEDLLNYGITEGMTFGDAFAQAGKMGATDKPEDAFSWTDPKTGIRGKYVYDFKVGDVVPPNVEGDEEEITHLPKGY